MKLLPNATALGLGAAAAVLAACGSSSSPTVTATQAPSTTASTSVSSTATTLTSSSRSSTTATTTTSSEKQTSSTTTTTTATATSTTTAPPGTSTATTRTATAPAFVGTNPTSGAAISHALAAAIAVLARSGYVPLRTSTYRPGDTLRILIGARPGTGAPAEHAFFFDQTMYLGTDARAPSAQISLLAQSDTEATLGYAIYHAAASAPSSVRRVRFALDQGQLTALDPLPSVAARR